VWQHPGGWTGKRKQRISLFYRAPAHCFFRELTGDGLNTYLLWAMTFFNNLLFPDTINDLTPFNILHKKEGEVNSFAGIFNLSYM